MALAEAITKQPWFRRLNMRASSFYQMMLHLDGAKEEYVIIETGCAWDKDNWGGQGQSTLIWDWVVGLDGNCVGATSIDITPASVEMARSQVHYVQVIESDSVKSLSLMDPAYLAKARLVYLDSYDWSDEANFESAFHHMAELTAIWGHLKSGCMIAVDDRHSAGRGKHWIVEGFMRKLGIEPVFCDYQVGWIKP